MEISLAINKENSQYWSGRLHMIEKLSSGAINPNEQTKQYWSDRILSICIQPEILKTEIYTKFQEDVIFDSRCTFTAFVENICPKLSYISQTAISHCRTQSHTACYWGIMESIMSIHSGLENLIRGVNIFCQGRGLLSLWSEYSSPRLRFPYPPWINS